MSRTMVLFSVVTAVLWTGLVQARTGEVTIGAQYGYVLSNSTSVNAVVDYYNSTYGFVAPHIQSAAKIGGLGTYRIDDKWAVGVSYSLSSPWTSSTKGSVTGKVTTYANLIGIRAEYQLSQQNGWDIFVSPTVGIGLYFSDMNVSSDAGVLGIAGSNKAAWGGAALGVKRFFDNAFGLVLEAGYQYAKSGSLRVDSQQNSSFRPGDLLSLPEAGTVNIDLGGPYISAGIELKF